MMFKRGAVAFVLGMAMCAPAQAEQYVATMTGRITNVHYDFGTFGLTPGQNQDVPLTVKFTFDPAKGQGSPYNTVGDAKLYGYAPNAPVQSIALTVNGITDTWSMQPGGSYYSEVNRADYGTFSTLNFNWNAGAPHYVNGQPTGSSDFTLGGMTVFVSQSNSVAFDAPFSGTVTSGTGGFLRQVQNAGRGYDLAYNFNTSARTISVALVAEPGNPGVGGVPEPATWALMIGGFGLAGRALRRRRAAAA